MLLGNCSNIPIMKNKPLENYHDKYRNLQCLLCTWCSLAGAGDKLSQETPSACSSRFQVSRTKFPQVLYHDSQSIKNLSSSVPPKDVSLGCALVWVWVWVPSKELASSQTQHAGRAQRGHTGLILTCDLPPSWPGCSADNKGGLS